MKTFDLEKALAGEPVKLSNGQKAIIYANIEQYDTEYPLKGLVYKDDGTYKDCTWTIHGRFYSMYTGDNKRDIVGMWEEPRPTVTLTLPCPLKEPQEDMYFINMHIEPVKSSYVKDSNSFHIEWLEQGNYFPSKEQAQAWIDAMKDSRR